MPLLGSAAMLLSFDIVDDVIAEHDRWHTQEHLPERLAVPGFLRGTRWTAARGVPRYMVLYEVSELSTLTSRAYLERLNNPSPWTARLMPNYRGMKRGLCTVLGSFGFGLGHATALIRFKPSPQAPGQAHQWLLREALPGLPTVEGLGSAHLLQAAETASMTAEQRLRGGDSGQDSAVIVTGYDDDAVTRMAETSLGARNLEAHGATEVTVAIYHLAYSLASTEVEV